MKLLTDYLQKLRDMKIIHNIYVSGLILVLLMISACDSGFDELNTNPARQTFLDPTFQLNRAIEDFAPTYGNLTYETTIVRQMFTPFTGVGTGANLNQDNRSQTEGNWNRAYPNIVKNLVDGIANVDPAKTNLLSILRIWKAHTFLFMTDTYGDVPYFQAGKAFLEGVPFPTYDSQDAIYADLLNELSAATAALDPGKDAINQEVMYSGDVLAWKRLGNSLMLRVAMRLVKVDPSKAQTFAAQAISGGLMESNTDNAVVRHNADFQNPVGTNLNGGQAPFYYLDREFVNWMKDHTDPRLSRIGVRYIGARSEGEQTEAVADRTFDAQVGIPQGFDVTNINPIAEMEGLASLYDYSQLDRNRLGSSLAPSFLVTYSQTQLLLAEAIMRGWASGDAAAVYESAIRANMEQFADWPGDTEISQTEIDDYITANPLEAGNEIEQINEQYWMSSFLNGPETWANFRRTGFPNVLPNPWPGGDLKTEDFIRRLTYPDSELTVNRDNLNVAVSRQGADLLDTRVWWDVK